MPATSKRNIKLTLLAHPFELALGAALAINGLAGIIGYPSPSVAALPFIVRLGYLAISLLGGIGVVVGLILNDPPSHVGLGKSLERASLYLVAASYIALAVMLVGNNGTAGVPTALVALVVGAACILRAQAIRKAALIILEQLRAASAKEDRRA
jgi:hypothetical protein